MFDVLEKLRRFKKKNKMVDGEPKCDYARMFPDAKYIAWMPYPEPVKEGAE